jgi:hypothetical protein
MIIVNEREVIEMTRREKVVLMENICCGISGAFLVWFFASWANVVAHNMTDQCYAWWNFFTLVF